jgi:AcrR family transcriptional regulator
VTSRIATEAGSTPGRHTRPRRTREEILAAAAKIFNEKGYDAASIQEIADDLGILKGSLYYHIKSKEEMLFEIILRGHREIREFVDSALRYPGTPLQRIRLFVQLDMTYCASNIPRIGLFFNDFRALSDGHRATVVALRDEYMQQLHDLIVEGQHSGLVCRDLNPRVTTINILVIKNSVPIWYRPDGPLSPSALGEALADFVVAGLACDPQTHVPGHLRQLASAPLEDGSTPPSSESQNGDTKDAGGRWFRRLRT